MSARILIVEDEALVAMELRFVLEDLGHEVVGTVADARSALEIASEARIDLALVDIHLSDGPTGIEVGRALGQDLGITVVFMTANPGMVRDGRTGRSDRRRLRAASASRQTHGICAAGAPAVRVTEDPELRAPRDEAGIPELRQLLYRSRSRDRTDSALQMSDILAEARPANLRDGITGVLTSLNGTFVQIIEGPGPAVDLLFGKLQRDPRHSDVVVIERRVATGRMFGDWAMVSPRLAAGDLSMLALLLDDDRAGLDAYGRTLAHALATQCRILDRRYGAIVSTGAAMSDVRPDQDR